MPELITIEEAARITGFPSEDIQYWAKSHKITSYSVTRDSRLVDLANTMISCSAFDPLKTSLPSLNKLPPN